MCCGGNSKSTSAKKEPTAEDIAKVMSQLPQAVLAPTCGLAGIGCTFPPDDGVKRQFSNPKVHPDGSLEYERNSDQDGTPPPIDGYDRDDANPWLFRPLWPECKMRMQGSRRDAKLGSINVVMICNNPEVRQHFQKYVSSAVCTSCPLRKP